LVNPSIIRKMIKTEKLTRVFRTDEVETFALNGVDIHIKEGEFVSVMGPSGCGKSTLLNILGLLDNPTEGSYQLNGTEVSNLNGKERSRFLRENIGFVFQSFILIDELNVYDNIRLPLNYHKISSGERKERVRQVLQRMKMGHRAMHYPQQLSGGQQQRIAIARAVVTNPKILFADEPTGNLDSKNGIEVMNLLSELNREGTTIVMVTHSERDAGFAHRTINLFDGQVVQENGNEKSNGFSNFQYQEYAN
jgi:putative ABC transport system ATP-binding protein